MKNILRFALLMLLFIAAFGSGNKSYAQTVTLSPYVGGLHSGNFNAGDRDAIFGFTIQVSGGAVTFNQFNFSSQNASQSYVTNGTLYRSPAATFNLATPGVPVGNVKFNGTTITVDNFNETVNNTTNYYYLVADAVNTSSNYNQFFINYGSNLATDINGTNYSTTFYSGQGYNFIAGTPVRLSINALATDVALPSTIITSPTSNIKIFQFSITNNAATSTTISALRINSNLGTVSQYFTNLRLYANTTNTFPGAATATGAASGSYVNFTGLSETLAAGATKYYWLYVNCSVTGSLPVNPQFSFLADQSSNAITTSTPAATNYNTFNATGYTYNINSAVVNVTNLTSGLTSGTLTAGQTGVALFGFSVATASGSITASEFNINSSNTADQYFGNGKLIRNSTNNYATGTKTQIGTVTFNGSYAEVTGLSETINTTAKFYFLVADNIGAASPTQTITFRFTSGQTESAVVQSAPVASSYNTYSFAGNTLTLPPPTAVITGLNSPGANNITTAISPGSSNVAVFGFKVTGFGPVTIDKFNMNFSAGSQNTFFTNGRLVESADEIYDAGDLSTPIGNVATGSSTNANIGDSGNMGLTFANGDIRNFFLVVDVNVYNNSSTPSTSAYAFTTAQTPKSIVYGSPYSEANVTSNVTGATLNFPPGNNTFIWTGNVSNSVTNSSNWAGFAAPSSTSNDIVIPGGRPNYPKLTGNSSIGDVTFSGTGGSIDLAGFTMAPDNIIVAANATASFVSTTGTGALTPAVAITINSGGTLNVSSPITMANATTSTLKNSGTLALTGAGALSIPNTTASAAATNTGTITQAGTGALSFGGALTNAGTIDKSSSGTFGVSGTLNNSGTITKSGTGVTTFTGAVTNTSTGAIINSGASGAMNFSSTLANSGLLELSGAAPITVTGAITGASGSSIVNSGTGALTLTANLTNPSGATITNSNTGGTITFSGTVSNAGTINHTGTGTIAFGSSLTNTGTFTQSSTGTLTVAGATTNNSPGVITLGGGPATFTGVISNASGATFNLGTAGTKDFNGALTFTNAGTMTQSGGSANIVATTFSNSGTFTSTGGTVNFDGAAQGINNSNAGTPVSFYNLTLSGSGTKTLGASGTGVFQVNSVGTITLTSNITFNTGTSKLTLKSDVNGSTTVAALPSGASITGTTVSVERYVTGNSANSRGYRLFSSPVSVSAASQITPNLTYVQSKAYTSGTGGATNGFDGAGNPTIYFYRENMAPNTSTFISGNYRGVSKINNSPASTFSFDGGVDANASLPIGNGFLFFFRGDKATTANPTVTTTIAKPTTTVAVGYLNQGNVVVKPWFTGASTLSYTAATPTTVRGFNLVGNPYASSIDWDLVTKTNIQPGIWVYNPAQKVYATYNGNGSGIGTNFNGTGGTSADIIPSGQGFFVKATSAAATLTFTEAHKVNTQVPATNLLLAGAPVTTPVFQYARIQIFKDSLNNEDALIFFDKNAKTTYSDVDDAEYLKGNSTVNISTRSSDNIDLAINTTPYPNAQTTLIIPLNVNITTTDIYQLKLTELKDVPPLYEIWLKDSFTQDSIDIRNNPLYTFNADATNAATFGRNRFSLVIRENKSVAYRLLTFTAVKSPTAVQLNWTTVNEANYTTFTVERSTDGGANYTSIGTIQSTGVGTYSLTDPAPNILGQNLYRLKQDDVSSLITYSAIVPVNFSITNTNPGNEPISVYPNPSSTTVNVAIQFTTLNLVPLYTIKIIGSTGDVVKTVSSNLPTWQGDISTFKPGVYFIQVYNELDNKLVGKTKFIKI